MTPTSIDYSFGSFYPVSKQGVAAAAEHGVSRECNLALANVQPTRHYTLCFLQTLSAGQTLIRSHGIKQTGVPHTSKG